MMHVLLCVSQFQLLPSALFKSSSDFIPLGKGLLSRGPLENKRERVWLRLSVSG